MIEQDTMPSVEATKDARQALARLRREGRWEEFVAHKEAIRIRLRDGGMPKKEANAEAYRRALQAFPSRLPEAATEDWPFSWQPNGEHHLPEGFCPPRAEADAYLLGLRERCTPEALAMARREMEDWQNLGCDLTSDQQLRVTILLGVLMETTYRAWEDATADAGDETATSGKDAGPEDEHLSALLKKAGTVDTFAEHVRWAYQQAQHIIQPRPGKTSLFLWQNATCPPPSPGAVAYVRMADTNPAKFYGDIVPKALAGEGNGDQSLEMPERDKQIVRKFDNFLAKFRADQAAEK